MAPQGSCLRCGRTQQRARLAQCPICRSWVCSVCAVRRHGKGFCSAHCAGAFFFGGDEAEAEQEEVEE